MREFADPLVDTLSNYQAQADHSGQTITIPWEAINKVITRYGSPAIDEKSFSKQYNSEQEQGLSVLNNIVDGNKDSFDQYGIRLVPTNQPADQVNNQQVIDQSHSTVSSTAMSQLKRQK